MRAPWASQLERLDLSNNPIGDGGARAIAASPCERLRVLELDYCRRLTEVGAQALAKSATLPDVLKRKLERDGGGLRGEVFLRQDRGKCGEVLTWSVASR